MIDFVGTPPFLRMAIGIVAIETMQLHIAETGLVLWIILPI